MFNRIRCHFFGHRPRRHLVKKSPFSAWTVCGRCNQLMTRGYFGWQPANDMEERRFKRELEKQAVNYRGSGESALDTDLVPMPWIATDNHDQ